MVSDIIMSALLNRIQNTPIITVDYDTSRKKAFSSSTLVLESGGRKDTFTRLAWPSRVSFAKIMSKEREQ